MLQWPRAPPPPLQACLLGGLALDPLTLGLSDAYELLRAAESDAAARGAGGRRAVAVWGCGWARVMVCVCGGVGGWMGGEGEAANQGWLCLQFLLWPSTPPTPPTAGCPPLPSSASRASSGAGPVTSWRSRRRCPLGGVGWGWGGAVLQQSCQPCLRRVPSPPHPPPGPILPPSPRPGAPWAQVIRHLPILVFGKRQKLGEGKGRSSRCCSYYSL